VPALAEATVGSARQPGPVTLVLSRQVKAGHEQAFEEVLRQLAVAVRAQSGHLAVTTLAPRPGGTPFYTVVSNFANRADADS
jgi:antibiotic biosynthesis monooxygenase (ABM) superfamily enzyme